MSQRATIPRVLAAALAALVFAGCERAPNMGEQPRYQPYQESKFFADGLSARPIVEGTVGRNAAGRDPRLPDGRLPVTAADQRPIAITRADLLRGQELYGVFCAPCHGLTGDGNGMIAQRGFNPPPVSYHQDRLRQAPDAHFYDVITDGFGAMFSYQERIEPADRWRIIAYIRALQLSRHVPADQLPAEMREQLQARTQAQPSASNREPPQ